MKHKSKYTVLAGAGFVAGLAAGYALAPIKRTRNIEQFLTKLEGIQENARRQSRAMKLKSSKHVRNVSGKVRKQLRDPIPDLYKATEGLSMSQEDVVMNG